MSLRCAPKLRKVRQRGVARCRPIAEGPRSHGLYRWPGPQKSIFARLGYVDSGQRPLRITSHQFRHWLNTLAQEGGLSQLEIARWMGRRKVGQNADYDHVTPLQRARRIQERLASGKASGPVAEQVRRIRDPVRRAEFVGSLTNTAHPTDLGICLHDWTALPCELHGACATCREQFN